jgi:lipoate---protein ligase
MNLSLVPEPDLGALSSLEAAATLLAYDEVLLSWVDQQQPAMGLLRLWESPSTFVVMGYGKQVAADVHVDACRSGSVPILRRCSGGGTVLQTVGCLSYSLILPIDLHPSLASIQTTTSWIMTQQAACLQAFLGEAVAVKGTSDLTIGTLKISGNAQRRGRRSVLFHGTILCQVDIAEIGRYLQVPSYQPEYRNNRGHAAFLRSLDVAPGKLSEHLAKWWRPVSDSGASVVLPVDGFRQELTDLVAKYLSSDFIYQR